MRTGATVIRPVPAAAAILIALAVTALPAFAQTPAGPALPEVFVDETVLEETQREVPTWDEDRPAIAPVPPGQAGNQPRAIAVLRWLDKMTARVRTIEVPVNETTTIQTLEFIVRACLERPPEEPPESAAFLDVWDRKPGEPVSEVFRGWMFASSPAISAMEHPVYDLWVMACKDAPAEAPAQ
jgi:hypothetical protein